ncbi:MAG: DoxX family protein [Rhizobacter sp.]|nr:DoxX family protein [Ferruginibacter sp.]
MKSILYKLTRIYPAANFFHLTMLIFRVLVSLELMIVHGFKKLGIGVSVAEIIPNPLHLPEAFNNGFAIGANIIAPVFIVFGLLTRLAILPVLAVTLTGYFVLHWNDALLIKDVPFIYSLVLMLVWVLGPGKYSLDYIINRKLIL